MNQFKKLAVKDGSKAYNFDVLASNFLLGDDGSWPRGRDSQPDPFEYVKNKTANISEQTVWTGATRWVGNQLTNSHVEVETVDLNYARTDGSVVSL